MAAGFVVHTIQVSPTVSYDVVQWVPDTSAPNANGHPVAFLRDSAGAEVLKAADVASLLTKLDTLHGDALPVGGGTKAAAARVNLATDDPLVVQLANLIKVPGKATFTRPADTTAYAIGDLMANSTTAGSVAALSWTGATLTGSGGKGVITSFLLGYAGANAFTARAHFLKTNHAVTNGDNGAFVLTSLDQDNYIGNVDVIVDGSGISGGKLGFSKCELEYELASGDTIYALLEALTAWTPASGVVFTGKPTFRRTA